MRKRAPLMFLGGCFIVVLQSVVAVGLWIGTVVPSCASTSQCGESSWCDLELGRAGRCDYCGPDMFLGRIAQHHAPLGLETNGSCTLVDEFTTIADSKCTTWNEPYDPNFHGYNTTAAAMV